MASSFILDTHFPVLLSPAPLNPLRQPSEPLQPQRPRPRARVDSQLPHRRSLKSAYRLGPPRSRLRAIRFSISPCTRSGSPADLVRLCSTAARTAFSPRPKAARVRRMPWSISHQGSCIKERFTHAVSKLTDGLFGLGDQASGQAGESKGADRPLSCAAHVTKTMPERSTIHRI